MTLTVEDILDRGRALKCLPRFGLTGPPDFDGERLHDAVVLAQAAGIDLHAWQVWALGHIFAETEDELLRWRTAAVVVSRQSGKTLLAHMVAVDALYRGLDIAFTAQDRLAASERWKEGVPFWQRAFGGRLQVRWANGSEKAWIDGGGSVRVVTPNDRGPRGMTLDGIVIDEAFKHSNDFLAAILPTLLTKPNSQLLMLSSAGTGASEMLLDFRERALDEETDSAVCWLEWAADTELAIDNEEAWAQAMPTLGEPGGIDIETVRWLFKDSPRILFEREFLSWWQFADAAARMLSMQRWADLAIDRIEHDADTLVFAPAVSPYRDECAVAAASVIDGIVHVEIVESRQGSPEWAAKALKKMADRRKGRIACDVGGASGTIAQALDAAKVKFHPVTARAHTRACGMFVDRVKEETLRHVEDTELDASVAVAKTRKLAGAWAWDTADQQIPIVALEAATVAVFGALTAEPRLTPTVRRLGYPVAGEAESGRAADAGD